MKNPKAPMTEADALRRLQSLCAQSEHAEGELMEKMRQWGIDEGTQARIMQQLTQARYVDDHRFAEAFIHDKIAFNGWGRRKIAQALWAKHVDEAVYTPLLDAVDEAQYLEALRPLVRQKYRSVKAKTEYERAMKVIKFAVGRGFEFEEVQKCLNEIADGTDDIDTLMDE